MVPRRRFFLIAASALAAGSVLLGLLAWSVVAAAHRAPEFYRRALALDTAAQAQHSDECLARMADLASDVQKPGRWEARFTAEQINGWLAVDVPRNHASLWGPHVDAPRTAISNHQASIACRYTGGPLDTVLSLTFDVYLAEPNVIALRLQRARAGLLPVPMADLLRSLAESLGQLGWPVTWRQADGDPVALIRIPPPRDQRERAVELERLELYDGTLYLAGRTRAPAGKSRSVEEPRQPPASPTAVAPDAPARARTASAAETGKAAR